MQLYLFFFLAAYHYYEVFFLALVVISKSLFINKQIIHIKIKVNYLYIDSNPINYIYLFSIKARFTEQITTIMTEF